jgi:UDP-glucose 4-epimerase
MRILVTGGAGFIGSHVVDACVAAGHHVAIVDNLASGRRENLNPYATFYEVDIRDAELLTEVFARETPDVVNHHAAQIDVGRSVNEPVYDAEVNILGTLNVLECARAQQARTGARAHVIGISSAAVYGPPDVLPVDERHALRPLSPYGASKVALELYLDVYRATHGLRTTILRYANVYGPRQDPHGEAGVVAIFVGKMLSGAVPVIHGTGEQTRDFIYVGDCARANLLAIEAAEAGPGPYNISTGEETTVSRLAERVRELSGFTGEITHGPERLGDIFRNVSDNARAREAFGWAPEVDLREGLARTIAYFRESDRSS